MKITIGYLILFWTIAIIVSIYFNLYNFIYNLIFFKKHGKQYNKCWNCPDGGNGSGICSDSLIN